MELRLKPGPSRAVEDRTQYSGLGSHRDCTGLVNVA